MKRTVQMDLIARTFVISMRRLKNGRNIRKMIGKKDLSVCAAESPYNILLCNFLKFWIEKK